jgi:DNA-binding protein HU-beta
VNKAQLVEVIANRTGRDQETVAEVVNAFIEVVHRSVVGGEKVVLSGFGTFHTVSRARRTARNLWTDQKVTVPPRNLPAFKPGKPFREAVSRRRRRTSAAGTSGSSRRRPR